MELKTDRRKVQWLTGSRSWTAGVLCGFLLLAAGVRAAPEHDLSTEKVLYTVANAHLDTQWRWTIQTTIDDYIKKTLDQNFAHFERYPDYVFSFEGAFRYMLMKEYYPQRYQTLSNYIAQGRWQVAGSTLENGDMNVVSPESLIRQALIGNNYFEDEFNKRSTDIFLPDCFGFSYTMPTWMTHCGINGFSSQKLSWGGALPTPFDIGVWKGPDGSSVIAALDPGAYTSDIESDLSNDTGWLNRINALGDAHGVYAGYKYYGTGDTGGSPSTGSLDLLEQSLRGGGPITVVSAGTDDLYNDITPAQKATLPVYDGELLMRIHGNGCYTSQAAMKRWNRQNELLADATERACAMADWLGAGDYPRETLEDAWIRFLWHSFHDDITGTSIPSAYHFSWNDEILSLNQFASMLGHAAGGIGQGLDTQVRGEAIVVYNPLALDRRDPVEATVVYGSDVPAHVRVFDGDTEVPSQVLSRKDDTLTVVFLAQVPSVGVKVFDVRASEQPCSLATGLSVTGRVLENALYRVTVNDAGDIASVFDKQNDRELLSGPSRLELLSNYSPAWPAWEIRYEDVQKAPYGYVGGPAKITIAESGPARVALRVERTCGDKPTSTFVQTISLTGGDAGGRVTVHNKIDWRTKGTLLKASFPLTASNATATYDLGMGTIQRGNNRSNIYEVPAQQWADLTHSDNGFGVSILNDSRYGWDKPADNLLRLTLLHTPSVDRSYTDQATQDLGQHELTYAIAPHGGTWIDGNVPHQAARLNQPLIAFQSASHAGALGKSASFLQVSSPQVFVKAVKKAQRSNELIVRVQELYGTSVSNVQLSVGRGIASAREVNGVERPVGAATVTDGKLVFNLSKYQPRTFALTLRPTAVTLAKPATAPVTLSYNLDAFSPDSNRSDGSFDDGMTYPAELMSDTLTVCGIPFRMGSRANGQKNATACSGQTVSLGSHGYDSLYLLAAARDGDTEGTFTVAGKETILSVQDYHENVVDWGRETNAPYLKRDAVAWVGTHRHRPEGNMAYEFCNLFLYRIDLPAGATSVKLPDNDRLVVFAMTLANDPARQVRPASALYDTLPYLPALAPKPETRTNLALDKPVSANSFIPGENPEKAVDGEVRNNSKWCSTSGAPYWLVVDLRQGYDVDTFVVRHAGAGGEGTNWNTSDYRIQASPNGTDNWTDLVNVQGNVESVSRHTIAPTSVRYLRLYITKPALDNNTAVRIYEFEVYGPCDGTLVRGDVSGPDGAADCRVDFYDLHALACDWFACSEPADTGCWEYWLERFPDAEPTQQPGGGPAAVLPDEALEAYWPVREGSGLTLHDTAGTDDAGTLLGATRPQWTAGWFSPHGSTNHALYFNSTGYLRVDDTGSGLYDLRDAISIAAWFKADDWNGNRRIVQKGNSDNQYRLLAENGEMVFHIHNVGRITASLPPPGVWHHVAAVFDGASMRMYLDGLEAAMMYAGGEIHQTTDPLYIGTKTPQAPSGDFFKGTLDDLRIYSVGLTEPQVRLLAGQGDNLPPAILDLQRRDDRLVSILSASPLAAAVWDINADTLTFQWSEAGVSPNVSFAPSDSVEDPEVRFAAPGDYTVQLAVTDGHGPAVTRATEFRLTAMDCAAARAMNERFVGDVTQDCYVNLADLLVLTEGWLDCVGDQCI